MKMMQFILLSLSCMFNLALADTINLRPYQKGDWQALIKSNNGLPIAVHFWGVTCAPCVKEMPQWGKFVSANKTANVIFIQVDQATPQIINKTLENAGLSNANNYDLIGPYDERLRYEVSPNWRGETPVTFLLDKQNQKTMKVGAVDFKSLKSWFRTQISAP